MIEKSVVKIYNLDFPQDMPDFGEGLIRSALNFAANRGAYIGKCFCTNATTILERMRFEKGGDCYTGDIPTLLGGTCCNCPIN
ncbi:hypothetical protein SDC9_186125 [bioreactor metagenome]|uniref:N-acetyltransferase domain-containing protein n=1 Tax=bioreactor metagenome TaxID=1076179 RepID=A0A645HHU6_9ZZZZ